MLVFSNACSYALTGAQLTSSCCPAPVCRYGISSITYAVNAPAPPPPTCKPIPTILFVNTAGMMMCTGGFLPSSSPGLLLSMSASNGINFTSATLQGGYVDGSLDAYIVPTAAGYIFATQDGWYLKMVQVRSIYIDWFR